MNLFKRQQNDSSTKPPKDVPPELQPYYQGESQQWFGWPLWLVGVIVLVVLVGAGLALFFWSPWDSGNSTGSNKPAGTSSHSNNSTSGNQNTTKNPPSSSPSQPKSTGNASDNTPASGTANQPATSKPALANTGPGDVAAVFVIAAAAGTVAYQVYLRRRPFTEQR